MVGMAILGVLHLFQNSRHYIELYYQFKFNIYFDYYLNFIIFYYHKIIIKNLIYL